jgi:hypothetical protein
VRAPVGKTGLGEAETRENKRKVNALRPSSHAANSLQRLFRGSNNMSNRVYVLSSLCFLAGAILAFRSSASLINGLYIAGSFFFLIAASLGVWKK